VVHAAGAAAGVVWVALIVAFYCLPVAMLMVGATDWVLTGGSGWTELTDGQREWTLGTTWAALAVPIYLKITGPDIVETIKHMIWGEEE